MDFVGHLPAPVTRCTPDLVGSLAGSAWAWSGRQGRKVHTPPQAGSAGPLAAPSVYHWETNGALAIRQDLWDKILLLPPQLAFGYILSTQEFSLQVWSTFRNVERLLAAIAVTGTGGTTLQDPFGLPLVFGPGQARSYPGAVPGEGEPSVADTIHFTFVGIATQAAVTGTRLALFSFRPNWAEAFVASIGYKTAVLTGYSGAEQRAQLRSKPRWGAAYQVHTTEAGETAALENLLVGWKAKVFGVPWWPDSTFLDADAADGSLILACDTSSRPAFEAGGLATLWTDAFTWEVYPVQAVAAGSMTLSVRLSSAWSRGTRVVPVRRARLMEDQSLGRPTNWLTQATFRFSCEVGPGVPAAAAGLTYAGFDLLAPEPNAREANDASLRQAQTGFDPGTGVRFVAAKADSPSQGQSYLWTCTSKASIEAFLAWLGTRKGMAVPFWAPTWRQDFLLEADVAADATSFPIRACGFTRFAFPLTSRRHLVFWLRGNLVCRKILASQENGAQENLTIDSAPGVLIPKGTPVCGLRLFRLASDDVEIPYITDSIAETRLEFVEVPEEVP